jgi:hypothetical protein
METLGRTQAKYQRNMEIESPKTPQWGVDPTKGSTPCYADFMAEPLKNHVSSYAASAHKDDSSCQDSVSIDASLEAALLGEDVSDCTAGAHETESPLQHADSIYDGDKSGSDGEMDIRESVEISGIVGIADYVSPSPDTRAAFAELAELAETEGELSEESTAPVPKHVTASAIDASKETLNRLRQHLRTINVNTTVTFFMKPY